MQLDRLTLGRMAKELGFVRDTLEKVCRLADVLKFMESDALLSEAIALRGGTAINLTIFDLPRLSADIDLDYCRSIDREKMLADRDIITDKISKYMNANGYTLSPKSKNYHALDSFVYEYVNCGGVKDNIKIEINYMLRCHVLPVARREVKLPWNEENLRCFQWHHWRYLLQKQLLYLRGLHREICMICTIWLNMGCLMKVRKRCFVNVQCSTVQ